MQSKGIVKRRLELVQPTQKKDWLIYGLSEFIGAFVIAFALSALSINWINGKPLEQFFGHKFFLGFFEGFIIKGSLILILIRWSVDINPAVTGYKVLIGYNSPLYGAYKITLQLLGGLLAGFLTYVIGSQMDTGLINHAISIDSIQDSFFNPESTSPSLIITFLFFIELIVTMIYLYPIFSKSIINEYRDLTIMLVISLNSFIGLAAGVGVSAANPVRVLALQLPYLIEGIESIGRFEHTTYALYITLTLVMLSAGFVAPLFYYGIYNIVISRVNPLIHKAIRFKNKRSALISRASYVNLQFVKKYKGHHLAYDDARYDEWVNL